MRLCNWTSDYITGYLDAQLINLSCPVMQPAKLASYLTIRSCCLKLLIFLN